MPNHNMLIYVYEKQMDEVFKIKLNGQKSLTTLFKEKRQKQSSFTL